MEGEPFCAFKLGPGLTDNERLVLGSTLRTWLRLSRKYCDRVENDVPYWYNERANVSILAAAAWRKGGVAVEEFTVRRGPVVKGKKGKSKSKNHRCDLWFQLLCTRYYAEAKILWPNSLDDQRAFGRQLRRKLGEACRQVRSLAAEEVEDADGLLAICFVVPELELVDEDRHGIADFYGQALTVLRDSSAQYVIAAYEVMKTKDNRGELRHPEFDGKAFPGVILAGLAIGMEGD
jgi:hypothetical protein